MNKGDEESEIMNSSQRSDANILMEQRVIRTLIRKVDKVVGAKVVLILIHNQSFTLTKTLKYQLIYKVPVV